MMDWNLAIEKEREVLKSIVALFYALAVLTDRIQGRSRPLRCFVLWILRPAMGIALDCIADAGLGHQALIRESHDTFAEARRYSRCFRAAARLMKRELKALDRCEVSDDGGPTYVDRHLPLFGTPSGCRFVGRDILASLSNLAPASDLLLRYAAATGPPVRQRCGLA